MVTKFGMSQKVGMRYIEGGKDGSPAGGKEVDEEVKLLLDDSYRRAYDMLNENRNQLEAVAKGLIEFESLSGSEVVDLINGKKISTEQHRRSQKPSRDIVPIKNRQRPLLVQQQDKGSSNTSGVSSSVPKKPARRPVNAASSGSSTPVPNQAEPVRKRTWGNSGDVNEMSVQQGNKSIAVEKSAVVAAPEEAASDTSWGGAIKGWLGYGNNQKATDDPPIAKNPDMKKDVEQTPKRVIVESVRPKREISEPAQRRLPSNVGPPVEALPKPRSPPTISIPPNSQNAPSEKTTEKKSSIKVGGETEILTSDDASAPVKKVDSTKKD